MTVLLMWWWCRWWWHGQLSSGDCCCCFFCCENCFQSVSVSSSFILADSHRQGLCFYGSLVTFSVANQITALARRNTVKTHLSPLNGCRQWSTSSVCCLFFATTTFWCSVNGKRTPNNGAPRRERVSIEPAPPPPPRHNHGAREQKKKENNLQSLPIDNHLQSAILYSISIFLWFLPNHSLSRYRSSSV